MDPRIERIPRLEKLLMAFRDHSLRVFERRAGGLLRHESTEDLVQGIHRHALRVAGKFECRSDPEIRACCFGSRTARR